jgi:hypothetical protein
MSDAPSLSPTRRGNVNERGFWRHSATGQRYGEWRASLIGEGDAS